MCEFCNNIVSREEHEEKSSWDRDNCIVKNRNNNYGIWIECDDYYYSGVRISSIHYCPYCGRKL